MIFKKKKEKNIPETHTIYESTYTVTLWYKDGGREEFLDVVDYDFVPSESGFCRITLKRSGGEPNTEQKKINLRSEDIVRREIITHTKTITIVEYENGTQTSS